jgi:hypothetical protein
MLARNRKWSSFPEEVFRHDGSLTDADSARRAVWEHDCVLRPLGIVTAIVISQSYLWTYKKAEASDLPDNA